MGGSTIKRYPFKKIRKKGQRKRNKLNSVKKMQTFPRYHLTWKVIGVVSIAIMLFTVILVPTIIVMIPSAPFSETKIDVMEVSTATERNESQIELSSLNVLVKRSETDEVENIPLEKYVASVVASEMPATFEIEALKAQAVAARTYIVNHMIHQQNDKKDAVISDTTEHQVYKNENELKAGWGKDFHWKMEKITSAVLATEGEIITYNAQPITPTFFSMSNGYTEDAENYWGTALPYLKSVESKWEENNPQFTEQKIFTIDEVSRKLEIPLEVGTIPIKIKRTASNRIEKLIVDGTTFTGREIREKLALRSNDFTIKQQHDHLIFTTKGYGHGVGMSQYGANGMAEEGKDYREILSYYYQDIDINTIKETLPALVAK